MSDTQPTFREPSLETACKNADDFLNYYINNRNNPVAKSSLEGRAKQLSNAEHPYKELAMAAHDPVQVQAKRDISQVSQETKPFWLLMKYEAVQSQCLEQRNTTDELKDLKQQINNLEGDHGKLIRYIVETGHRYLIEELSEDERNKVRELATKHNLSTGLLEKAGSQNISEDEKKELLTKAYHLGNLDAVFKLANIQKDQEAKYTIIKESLTWEHATIEHYERVSQFLGFNEIEIFLAKCKMSEPVSPILKEIFMAVLTKFYNLAKADNSTLEVKDKKRFLHYLPGLQLTGDFEADSNKEMLAFGRKIMTPEVFSSSISLESESPDTHPASLNIFDPINLLYLNEKTQKALNENPGDTQLELLKLISGFDLKSKHTAYCYAVLIQMIEHVYGASKHIEEIKKNPDLSPGERENLEISQYKDVLIPLSDDDTTYLLTKQQHILKTKLYPQIELVKRFLRNSEHPLPATNNIFIHLAITDIRNRLFYAKLALNAGSDFLSQYRFGLHEVLRPLVKMENLEIDALGAYSRYINYRLELKDFRVSDAYKRHKNWFSSEADNFYAGCDDASTENWRLLKDYFNIKNPAEAKNEERKAWLKTASESEKEAFFHKNFYGYAAQKEAATYALETLNTLAEKGSIEAHYLKGKLLLEDSSYLGYEEVPVRECLTSFEVAKKQRHEDAEFYHAKLSVEYFDQLFNAEDKVSVLTEALQSFMSCDHPAALYEAARLLLNHSDILGSDGKLLPKQVKHTYELLASLKDIDFTDKELSKGIDICLGQLACRYSEVLVGFGVGQKEISNLIKKGADLNDVECLYRNEEFEWAAKLGHLPSIYKLAVDALDIWHYGSPHNLKSVDQIQNLKEAADKGFPQAQRLWAAAMVHLDVVTDENKELIASYLPLEASIDKENLTTAYFINISRAKYIAYHEKDLTKLLDQVGKTLSTYGQASLQADDRCSLASCIGKMLEPALELLEKADNITDAIIQQLIELKSECTKHEINVNYNKIHEQCFKKLKGKSWPYISKDMVLALQHLRKLHSTSVVTKDDLKLILKNNDEAAFYELLMLFDGIQPNTRLPHKRFRLFGSSTETLNIGEILNGSHTYVDDYAGRYIQAPTVTVPHFSKEEKSKFLKILTKTNWLPYLTKDQNVPKETLESVRTEFNKPVAMIDERLAKNNS